MTLSVHIVHAQVFVQLGSRSLGVLWRTVRLPWSHRLQTSNPGPRERSPWRSHCSQGSRRMVNWKTFTV